MFPGYGFGILLLVPKFGFWVRWLGLLLLEIVGQFIYFWFGGCFDARVFVV